ncbi:MAG: acyl carrier protein [Clostridia bacterium]|nr:acyl carrier protein [Clostridia bacterium]
MFTEKEQAIAEKLKSILAMQNPGDARRINEGGEDSGLVDYFGLNSVGMIYMIIVIESEFGITFDDVGMNDFATLGDVVRYIEKRQN